jgi:hypothetical protein
MVHTLRIVAGPSVWGWIILSVALGRAEKVQTLGSLTWLGMERVTTILIVQVHASEVGRIEIRHFLHAIIISFIWRF